MIVAARAVEETYYLDGTLDGAEWQAPASEFTRLEYPHRADLNLTKLHWIQSISLYT